MGHRLQHMGVLLEQGDLVATRTGCSLFPAPNEVLEADPPWVLSEGERVGPGQQGTPVNEAIDQVRSGIQQRLHHRGHRGPQALGVLPTDDPTGPAGLDIPTEHLQDLSEREIGITDPGVGVAPTRPGHQVLVISHRLPDEFVHQHRLATARLSGHEDHPPATREGHIQRAIQAGQLVLPRHEHRPPLFEWLPRADKGGLGQRRSGSH